MSRTKTLTRFAICLILCLALNYLEATLFALLPLPIPGCKIGLSNAVVLYLIAKKRFRGAYLLAVLRALFNFLLFGSLIGFFFSLTGGLFSVTAMALSLPLITRGYSYLTVSVIGSVCFQIGQMLVAALLYGAGVLYLLPLLLTAALVFGALLGILQNLLETKMKTVDKSA